MVKMYYKRKYIGSPDGHESIDTIIVSSVDLAEKIIDKWNRASPNHWAYEALDYIPYWPESKGDYERVAFTIHDV